MCAVAVMQSCGIVRDLIHRFKYGGEVWVGALLADFLTQGLRDPRLKGRSFDAVVPVPLHPLRRREREFNQAEVLSRELARKNNLAFCEALERLRYTVTQTAFLTGAVACKTCGMPSDFAGMPRCKEKTCFSSMMCSRLVRHSMSAPVCSWRQARDLVRAAYGGAWLARLSDTRVVQIA
mgnify:CR=1 FL=1